MFAACRTRRASIPFRCQSNQRRLLLYRFGACALGKASFHVGNELHIGTHVSYHGQREPFWRFCSSGGGSFCLCSITSNSNIDNRAQFCATREHWKRIPGRFPKTLLKVEEARQRYSGDGKDEQEFLLLPHGVIQR